MSANEKAQKRVNIMVGFMITAFIVAWTPYSIVSLMETFAEESGGFQISPGAATIPSLFAKGSIVFNPLIYGVFNTQVGYSRPPFSPPLPPHPPNFYIMAISKCGWCMRYHTCVDIAIQSAERPQSSSTVSIFGAKWTWKRPNQDYENYGNTMEHDAIIYDITFSSLEVNFTSRRMGEGGGERINLKRNLNGINWFELLFNTEATLLFTK